jgi:hypothetical protein
MPIQSLEHSARKPRPWRSATHLAAVLFFCAAYATAAAEVLTFDNPEDLAAWKFDPGAEFPGATGSLTHDAESGHSAAGELALNFDFTGGGNYVSASTALPTEPPVSGVRLWLRKPDANLMFVRAVDQKGETFQKDLRYDYRGWQQILINFQQWDYSWGGDGTFDTPATQFHIVIEGQGGTKTGSLLIDDVEWLAELPGDSWQKTTTYIESSFTTDSDTQTLPWTTSGPQGVSLSGNTWTYRFTADQNTCGLHHGYSALGRPEALLITLDSDGSGHELHATLGSHFQNFSRLLGTLDETGEITLEVPLGDMQTWTYSGGENDGIVRYPLRLLNIALIRKGEREEGTLKLKHLAFRTSYDTRSPVIVVPSVKASGADLVNFDVTLRSLHDEPLAGQLRARLQTPTGTISTEAIDVIAPPLTGRTLIVPAHFGGHPVIEGEFTFTSKSTSSRPQSITIAKPRQCQPEQFTLDPNSRMGVGMYLYRFHAHPSARAEMDKLCRLAAAAGVKWTREEFHWNWVEKTKGRYDWSFYDQLVESAQQHGISIYGLVCYWTEWSQPPFDDRFVTDYCTYLRVLVNRYKDRIHHWEIWNEPNIFFWPGDKSRYAVLLREAYKAIKETDPTAKVLGMSTAGIDIDFIQRMTELGVEYDDLTVHPYRHTLEPLSFKAELERTSAMFDNRPIWITEMGWPSNIGGVTERQQAALVSGVYLTALSSPVVRNVSWYDFREDGEDPFYNEHHFGLIRHDMTPKIGYAALATIGELFKDARLLDAHADERGLLAARYETSTGYLTVLAQQDQTTLARLRFSPDDLTIRDMVGGAVPASLTDDITALLMQRGEPFYVHSQSPLSFEHLEDAITIQAPPGGLHPGDPCELNWLANTARVVGIDHPPGWKQRSSAASDKILLSIPQHATPGEHFLRLTITDDINTWELPHTIQVTPDVVVR